MHDAIVINYFKKTKKMLMFFLVCLLCLPNPHNSKSNAFFTASCQFAHKKIVFPYGQIKEVLAPGKVQQDAGSR